MTSIIKNTVQRILQTLDYRVAYAPSGQIAGLSFHEDIKVLVHGVSPVCFDIGANEGQTIKVFKEVFKDCTIHAFEPSTESFKRLQEQKFGSKITLHKFALGQKNSQEEFYNLEDSCLSSFLPLDRNQRNRFRDTKVLNKELVEVRTVDWFVQQNNIKKIDILKTDTQGFDLEVLKGATESFKNGIIRNVFVELNFVKLYQGQSDASQIVDFLAERNTHLVDYYDKRREAFVLEWCNALYTCR